MQPGIALTLFQSHLRFLSDIDCPAPYQLWTYRRVLPGPGIGDTDAQRNSASQCIKNGLAYARLTTSVSQAPCSVDVDCIHQSLMSRLESIPEHSENSKTDRMSLTD